MKTLPKSGIIGINDDLKKSANDPVVLAKLERDRISFNKIKGTDKLMKK